MVIVKGSYTDPDIVERLAINLQVICPDPQNLPLFLCIGSDRHILDSFGPLTGSLLKDKIPALDVYGTLHDPIHARNLVSRLNHIYKLHSSRLEIAIDASLGNDEDLGVIRIRQGPLLPGKALAKKLPPIGHLSITGVVGTRSEKRYLRSNTGSLSTVYGMAWAVSEAVLNWYNRIVNNYA